MIDSFEIVGLIAATLTTWAYVPQVYKTWKSKSALSLSLTMYLTMFCGYYFVVGLWYSFK